MQIADTIYWLRHRLPYRSVREYTPEEYNEAIASGGEPDWYGFVVDGKYFWISPPTVKELWLENFLEQIELSFKLPEK